VSLMGVRPGGAGLSDPPLVPLVLAGALVSACAFAFTCYAPLRALPAIAMSTLLGHLVFLAVQDPQASMPWAAACAAVTIGLVSYAIAGRVGVPPLIVVVPALVPMLPGLLIYRGLSYMSDGDTQGILLLSAAAATTIALAAGVIMGEYIAQPLTGPLTRNARRIEDRLAGPRLVGIMHGTRIRRRDPAAARAAHDAWTARMYQAAQAERAFSPVGGAGSRRPGG